MRIRGGPTVLDFVGFLEQPVDGLVAQEGSSSIGTWTLDLAEIKADTARLGEQCPDLSLESRATLSLETSGLTVVGTGSFELDSWTVEGWQAVFLSTSAESGEFSGTLRLELGGDDFGDLRFSEGFYGGNDGGEQTIELGFASG